MPPLSIMIKPASSLCNLRCKYCFYADVSSQREFENFGLMAEETAEKLISSALDFADGESVAFAFQGGEPLLRGMEFFESFAQKVDFHNTKGSEIFYSLQTNGILIDEKWAEFFRKNRFLIGLSLDGNYGCNRFRVDANNENVYYTVSEKAEILKKHKVEFNILTVLTGLAAENGAEIYKALRDSGYKYLQFIPCLRPFGDKSENQLYMTPKQFEKFLIEVFNLYVKDFYRGNYVSVRYFDNLVRMYLGDRPEQCGLCGHCTHQFVAEGNGNIYPCDFYCTDEWLLGNINEVSLESMAKSEKAKKFIVESLSTGEECKACKFFPLCRGGGCKRQKADRDYCQSYKSFFSSCLPLFRMFKK